MNRMSRMRKKHQVKRSIDRLYNRKEEGDTEKLYVVYANINSSEEDFSFILTALYHWEKLYPSFTLELTKDPEEIVVKKIKPKEEIKKLILDQVKEQDKKIVKEEVKGEDKEKGGQDVKEEVKVYMKEEVKQDANEVIQEEVKDEIKQDAKEVVQEVMKEEVKQVDKEVINEEVKEGNKEEAKIEVQVEEKQDAKEIVKEDVKEEVNQDAKVEVKEDVKEEVKEEAKIEVQVEENSDAKEIVKQDIKEEGKQDAKEEAKGDIKEEEKPEIQEEQKEKNNVNKELLLEAISEQEKTTQKILQQIAEIESNNDLQELIQIQKQQQQQPMSKYINRYDSRTQRGGKGPNSKRDNPLDSNEQLKKYQPYLSSKYNNEGISGIKQQPYTVFGFQSQATGSASQFYSSIPTIANYSNIGLTKFDQIYEEIVKQTWEDVNEDDTSEEKMRKLNERNYNITIQSHLKESIMLAAFLYQRYSAPISEPLPYKKALEFSSILLKAYRGQIEPIPINPFMKKENTEKKLSVGKLVNQMFPLIMKTIEGPRRAKELQPGYGPPITIAPKQLIVSLCEKRISHRYEQIVETKTQALKNLEKNPIDGFNCNIIHQSLRRQGASISIIVQEFIQLIRSLVIKNQLLLNSEVESVSTQGYQIQKSIIKMQKQQEQFLQELLAQLNLSINKLANEKWQKFSLNDQQIIIGLLNVLGGWYPSIRTGQTVLVEINNQWVEAIVVDEGLGKKRLSVILENDDQLQIMKVQSDKVKPHQKFQWPFDQDIGNYINQEQLCQATINLYSQAKDNIYQENFEKCDMLNEQIILLMLLNICSQIKWNTINKEKETFKQFMSILLQITQQEKSEEDKTKIYWEKSLIDSWEKIIDKDEIRNYDFFVVRENCLIKTEDPFSQNIQQEEIKDEIIVPLKIEELKAQQSELQRDLRSAYNDTEFGQPVSSYLKGLQEPIPKKNQSEAALKLLIYWEKNIIPKIIEFVRSTYKPWEMELSFEQLRHHLRHGDSAGALEDAMTMCERKLPQGCVIPDDNYDWTAKMIDECIVDSWALAKFKPSRQQQYSSQVSGSQASQFNQSGETSFPLLNKLMNYGIDEVVIQIKAVDLKSNVVLAEFQDSDTMQVHSFWIPVSHLNDLHNPLPPRSVGISLKTLKTKFWFNSVKVQQCYARQTIIKIFHSMQTNQQSFEMPSSEMKLEELISWNVWEEYNKEPITGWMGEMHCAIPNFKEYDQTSSLIEKQNPTLQEIVEANSSKIVLELLLNQENEQNSGKEKTLMKIKSLFENSIKKIDDSEQDSQNMKIVSGIIDWVVINWYSLSERIRNDRAIFDLCKEYEKYVNREQFIKDDEGKQFKTTLLPLHELTSAQSQDGIGTLIMFKKSGCHLTPTSKIQFYSDENKVNQESEISAGSEGKRDLPPLLLNHGKIWLNFDQGTTALLPRHQQSDLQSQLPCAIVQIPSYWPVCCWLTEIITSSLIQSSQKAAKFIQDSFQKLISALIIFYEEAKAPHMLKSVILILLARIIRKLRFIYQENESNTPDENFENHLSRLFVKEEFLLMVLSELMLAKETDEQQIQNQGQQVLYSAFVQDCVEFILTVMMPTFKKSRISTYKDLLNQQKIQMPEWSLPLIKVAYFMHYFSGEVPLPLEMINEIYEQTKLTHKQLDHIFVIRDLPADSEIYSKAWIKEKIIGIFNEAGARILNPASDFIFPEDSPQTLVIIVDDFNQLIKNQKFEEPNKQDDESDNDDLDEEVQEKEDEKEEILMPTIWACPQCTLENPIDFTVCDMCQQARPSMDMLIAQFQAQLNAIQPKNEDSSQKKEEKARYMIKLENIAIMISKIIKSEEKRIIKEQKRKEKEEQKKKEEEETKKKQEEEKFKKQQEEEKKKKEKEELKLKKDKKDKNNSAGKQDESKKRVKKDVDIIEENKDKTFEMYKEIFKKSIEKDESVERLAQEEKMQKMKNDSFSEGENSIGLGGGEDAQGDDQEDHDIIWKNSVMGQENKKKLIELGIDQALIDSDPDLAQAIAESMLAEQILNKDQANLINQIEDKKKIVGDDGKKEKAKIVDKKKMENNEEVVLKPKITFTLLKVLVGQNKVFEDIQTSRIVYNVLIQRLQPKDKKIGDEFTFSEKVQGILKEIHQNFKIISLDQLQIPSAPILEDLDITKESIRDSQLEDFMQKCSILVETDVKTFMMLLECQGYDFWFQKVSYTSYLHENLQSKKLNISMLEKLKVFIETDMTKESKGIMNISPTDLRLLTKTSKDVLDETQNPINYFDDSLLPDVYPEINEKLSLIDVRYQWALIKTFNKYLAPAVPYINNSQSISDIPTNTIPLTLSSYMSSTRNLCLMNVKFDLRHLILEKTSVQIEDTPKLYFERLKLGTQKENDQGSSNEYSQASQSPQRRQGENRERRGGKDRKYMESMFLQACDQIKDFDFAMLRPKKPAGAEPHLAFQIVFRGEYVVGEGGPYRQFFSDISSELQPYQSIFNKPGQSTEQPNSEQENSQKQPQTQQKLILNLLQPSPNNKQSSNIGKDKFIITPSKNQSFDLTLYEYLGVLMGVCIRTGAHMTLDLPQFVWKQLVSQHFADSDLIEIDLGFWKLMSFMLSVKKKVYDESIQEVFAVTLSDESVMELRENGRDQRVTFEQRIDYIKEAIYARMKECHLQCEAIKRGIIKIVPEALLNMVTSSELETWICGKNIVDLDLLRRHTKYGGDKKNVILNEESRRIKFFWDVMKDISEEDRQKFIKFCWGQQRLPANDEEFERRSVRFMIKPSINVKNGDKALPKADTCFFNLELPDYSTYEIMKQKILLAIRTDCDSLDAEQEMVGAHQQAPVDLEQSYDEEY